MGSCKDCRFWDRRPDRYQDQNSRHGRCSMLGDIKIDVGIMLVTGEFSIGENVTTPDDFGCVQFEATERP